MNSSVQSLVWLHDSPIAIYAEAYKQHLIHEAYSSQTIKAYFFCIAHFAHWITQSDLDIHHINERTIQEFINEHLLSCTCTSKYLYAPTIHAALIHLINILNDNGITIISNTELTPVDNELQAFDDYMNHVKGLAKKTRRQYLCIIGRLLTEQFSGKPIEILAIKSEDVRQFINRQKQLYSTSGNFSLLITALRGYFRYRTTRGDQVNHLIGVANYPANWQLSSLPKALNNDEVDCLLKALDYSGASNLRTKAIVHCALDLGLRGGEIANLGLDDIDWQSATITLKKTKSRREDIMPLPEATGAALADYLRFERPETITNRSVFVHSTAPREQPVAPDFIRKAIRQAYARAGLPYTRAHLLRHTMASRLLEKGSSLKEVADVLRHRSLNTTMIYAKLDSKNLVEVALPWPGSTS